MKLWYMLGNDLRAIEDIVEIKHGLTYYLVTYRKPGVIGAPNLRTKIFTRYIVRIDD